jgi:hypothetical protein
LQRGVQLTAAAANGLDVQAGDQGQQLITAPADLLRFQSDQPTALLFVQAAKQEIQALMENSLRVFNALLAQRTSALMKIHNSASLLQQD